MNPSYVRSAFSTFVILIAMLACGLPSQATQSAPTTDPGIIQTAIANTMQASAQQTAIAPAAATETPADVMGVAIAQTQDGGTQYTDEEPSRFTQQSSFSNRPLIQSFE